MRQVFYYKMRQFYYKMQELLQIAMILLQNATFITNCDSTQFKKQPPKVFFKKGALSQNPQEQTFVGVSFLIKFQASGRRLH